MLFTVYGRFVPNMTRQDGSAIDRLLATRFSTTNLAGQQAVPPARSNSGAANEPGHEAQPPPVMAALAA
jgi:integrase